MSGEDLRKRVSEALDTPGGIDAPAHAALREELAHDADAAAWAADVVRLDALLRGWPAPARTEAFWEGLAARVEQRVAGARGGAGPDLTSPPYFDDEDARVARRTTPVGGGVDAKRLDLEAKRAEFSLEQLSQLGDPAPRATGRAAPSMSVATAAVVPPSVAAPPSAAASAARAVESPAMDAPRPVVVDPPPVVEAAMRAVAPAPPTGTATGARRAGEAVARVRDDAAPRSRPARAPWGAARCAAAGTSRGVAVRGGARVAAQLPAAADAAPATPPAPPRGDAGAGVVPSWARSPAASRSRRRRRWSSACS